MEATVPAPGSKPLWKSKIFWVNAATGILELCQAMTEFQLVPPGALVGVNAVANVVLRVFTRQPVTVMPQSSPPPFPVGGPPQ
jgi:hypothetical protein